MALSSMQLVTCPENKDLSAPTGIGTGFILKYKEKFVIITADHVIHGDDYAGKKQRNGLEDKVAIITNRYRLNQNGQKEGEMFSLGAFYFFEHINLSKDTNSELFDTAFSILPDDVMENLICVTAGVKDYNTDEIIIKAGYRKLALPYDSAVTPNTTDTYFVSGNVQVHWETAPTGEKVLASGFTFHNDMRFHHTEGDYIVLESPEVIESKLWKGLSGSPVFNQEGFLLGVLSGGIPNSHFIYVVDINKIIHIIDSTLQIEEINKNK